MPWLHRQISEGVSKKLCCLLWLLKGLKLTLKWKRYLSPSGSWIPKILLVIGRQKVLICFLRTSKNGMSLKWVTKMFQEAIAWWKKLFMYLKDLHLNSRNVFSLVWPYKSLRLGGSLSFKYEGVLLFKILWIWRIRLHIRRSDRLSHPNSSYNFEQLEQLSKYEQCSEHDNLSFSKYVTIFSLKN